MPDMAHKLLGDPPRRTAREWRYGFKGSLAVYLESGTWKNYESGEGGGVLGLIQQKLQTDQRGALDWLTREGLLPGETARRMPQNPQTGPGPASATQKPAEAHQREPDPADSRKLRRKRMQVRKLGAAAVPAENTPGPCLPDETTGVAL